MHIVYADISVA